jgi:predicted Rossmann fold nucleotide-binding protein DprA/Smf involved in DNA uptake
VVAWIHTANGPCSIALPGDVDRKASEGCNLLIRDGAFPVLDPEDLVEELGLVSGLVAGH